MTPAASRPCTHCGAPAALLFVARDMNRRVSDEGFPYYRCSRCALVFLAPLPADLGRYYPSNYHEFPATLDELLRGADTEAFKLEALGPARGRRLLEIGPSFGKFAARAKQAGFAVEVMEMDQECCRYLERVVGVRAHHGEDVAAAAAGLGTFDVIALWHSLEHLPNPWESLHALAEHIAPGGSLAIATPNPRSLQFRLFGARWVHLDAPRHVNLIPHGVLEERLARHGFRRTRFTSEDEGARECNLLGWIASTRTRLPRWQRPRLVSAAWRLTVPLSRLLERDPYGAAYTIVFEKTA